MIQSHPLLPWSSLLLSKIHAKHSFRISAGGPGAKKEQTFTKNSKQLPFQTSSLS